MIEYVENVHPELEVLFLSDGKTPDQREVPILLRRTTESVARRVAPAGCSRIRGKARGRNYWSRTEASGIEVMGYLIGG